MQVISDRLCRCLRLLPKANADCRCEGIGEQSRGASAELVVDGARLIVAHRAHDVLEIIGVRAAQRDTVVTGQRFGQFAN